MIVVFIDAKYKHRVICFNPTRYSSNDVGFEKSMEMGSDPSDSDESDDDDIQGSSIAKPIDLYDPKEFENLEASTEIKELFQNIIRQICISVRIYEFIFCKTEQQQLNRRKVTN